MTMQKLKLRRLTVLALAIGALLVIPTTGKAQQAVTRVVTITAQKQGYSSEYQDGALRLTLYKNGTVSVESCDTSEACSNGQWTMETKDPVDLKALTEAGERLRRNAVRTIIGDRASYLASRAAVVEGLIVLGWNLGGATIASIGVAQGDPINAAAGLVAPAAANIGYCIFRLDGVMKEAINDRTCLQDLGAALTRIQESPEEEAIVIRAGGVHSESLKLALQELRRLLGAQ